MEYLKYLLVYLIIINFISFLFFYLDKQKARKEKWRIKENTLHLYSFLGGSLGSIAAMILFHHKTKKLKFKIITIIAFIFNIYIIYQVVFKYAFFD